MLRLIPKGIQTNNTMMTLSFSMRKNYKWILIGLFNILLLGNLLSLGGKKEILKKIDENNSLAIKSYENMKKIVVRLDNLEKKLEETPNLKASELLKKQPQNQDQLLNSAVRKNIMSKDVKNNEYFVDVKLQKILDSIPESIIPDSYNDQVRIKKAENWLNDNLKDKRFEIDVVLFDASYNQREVDILNYDLEKTKKLYMDNQKKQLGSDSLYKKAFIYSFSSKVRLHGVTGYFLSPTNNIIWVQKPAKLRIGLYQQFKKLSWSPEDAVIYEGMVNEGVWTFKDENQLNNLCTVSPQMALWLSE
ncbi:MAG: hypothetical protein ACKO0V_16615 [bacterium]